MVFERINTAIVPDLGPWILVGLLTASYIPFMAAFIAKKPSDKQCARQISVWC